MQLRDFIKDFTFLERDRPHVELGPGTYLNADTHMIQLENVGGYSTDPDLYVKTKLAYPQAVKQWKGFEVFAYNKSVGSEVRTSLGYRLSDGTDEYFWNGSAWEINAADWNTEAEVASNISSFPVTSRKLQIVINLVTTDSTLTPEVFQIKVLYGALLDSEIEDIIFRSLVPSIRDSVTTVTRYVIVKAVTGNTIALDDYPLDSDLRVVGVDAVFNHTTDPEHDIDIYSSHTTKVEPSDPWVDGTVDVITLTEDIDVGERAWIRLLLQPVVAEQTSRDYYEVEHIPSLILESIAFIDPVQRNSIDHVGNRDDFSAVSIQGPEQGHLEITLAGITDKVTDSLRLNAALTRYFGQNPLITSTGLDESYKMRLVDVYTSASTADERDTRMFRKTFRIENFCIWDRASEEAYLVERLQATGRNVSFTVERI